MALMDTTDLDRDVAVRRNAAANHAQRLLRSPSSNSISGPSNWVIALTEPLLANVLLDEVDWELERRGHRFVRYADDCNVYVKSRKAGERVLKALRGCYAKLALKVNESKTAVAEVWGRKFLGYCFWAHKDETKRAVAGQTLERLRQRLRELTRRTSGRSLAQIAERLRAYLPGWKAYFRLAQTPKVMRGLDTWLRHRLRAVQLKQWRRGPTIFRELCKLGASSRPRQLFEQHLLRRRQNQRRTIGLSRHDHLHQTLGMRHDNCCSFRNVIDGTNH